MPIKTSPFLSVDEIRIQSADLRQKIAALKQDADGKINRLNERIKELEIELRQIRSDRGSLREGQHEAERELPQLQYRCPTHNVIVSIQGEETVVPLHHEQYICPDCGFVMFLGPARGVDIGRNGY